MDLSKGIDTSDLAGLANLVVKLNAMLLEQEGLLVKTLKDKLELMKELERLKPKEGG